MLTSGSHAIGLYQARPPVRSTNFQVRQPLTISSSALVEAALSKSLTEHEENERERENKEILYVLSIDLVQ